MGHSAGYIEYHPHFAQYITPAEAARRLGVHRTTIWRRIRSGRLPSAQISGERRIPWHQVIAPAHQSHQATTLSTPRVEAPGTPDHMRQCGRQTPA